jgi:subtilisin family serine protease
MNEWLVIRRARPAPISGSESLEPVANASSATDLPSGDESKVALEEAIAREDLPAQNEITTAARPMPISLINPFSKAEAAATRVILAKAKASGATWGLRALGVDPKKLDGGGVSVAIIDTGIKRSHPAFSHMAREAIVEADFTKRPGGDFGAAQDQDGHGTHCAATICGGEVDGIRIGVAPKIEKLFVAKAIGGERGSAALLESLEWAVANNADVISMSLGFDFVGYQLFLTKQKKVQLNTAISMALTAFRDNVRVFDAWMQLLRTRRKQGFDPIVFAATGNESDRPSFSVEKASPSEAESVVAVGAIDESFGIAPFSNTNPTFVGPGVDVLSAGIDTKLSVMSGTSMACPHMAGLAALYWQVARSGGPPATAERVLRMMARSAEDHFGLFRLHQSADVGGGMPHAPGV